MKAQLETYIQTFVAAGHVLIDFMYITIDFLLDSFFTVIIL